MRSHGINPATTHPQGNAHSLLYPFLTLARIHPPASPRPHGTNYIIDEAARSQKDENKINYFCVLDGRSILHGCRRSAAPPGGGGGCCLVLFAPGRRNASQQRLVTVPALQVRDGRVVHPTLAILDRLLQEVSAYLRTYVQRGVS